MDWKEFWSYFVSMCSYIISRIPHSFEEWTSFFALLTVIVTFFFITIPRVFYTRKCLEKKRKALEVQSEKKS